jgi:regulator of replication initiation timing
MSNQKPRYSLEQHDKLALELQTMRDRLSDIYVELGEAYPFKVADVAKKAINSIDALRSILDGEVCKEQFHKKNIDPSEIYYRAGRKDYKRNPKPIYPLREIGGGK